MHFARAVRGLKSTWVSADRDPVSFLIHCSYHSHGFITSSPYNILSTAIMARTKTTAKEDRGESKDKQEKKMEKPEKVEAQPEASTSKPKAKKQRTATPEKKQTTATPEKKQTTATPEGAAVP